MLRLRTYTYVVQNMYTTIRTFELRSEVGAKTKKTTKKNKKERKGKKRKEPLYSTILFCLVEKISINAATKVTTGLVAQFNKLREHKIPITGTNNYILYTRIIHILCTMYYVLCITYVGAYCLGRIHILLWQGTMRTYVQIVQCARGTRVLRS